VKNNRLSLACALALLALLALPLPTLAGPRASAPPRVVSLQPNYSSKLDHRLAWDRFPVRVYFVPDGNYTPEREEIARDGFDHWTRATSGFIQYMVTRVARSADIVVRFNPDLSGGLTRTHFRKARLFRADMSIGVDRDDPDDIECAAAHEFGHALGIDGHSDDRDDLMFPVHVVGRSFRVTERDVNTLASAYQSLARKLLAQMEARVTGMDAAF
jgi:hypothetical protein